MKREEEMQIFFKSFFIDEDWDWSQDIKDLKKQGVKPIELIQEITGQLLLGTSETIFTEPNFSFELFERFISPHIDWEEIAENIIKKYG